MSQTLLSLRTLCLSWLDDVNGGYFTTPQMNVFLNNAQKEVQKLLLQAGELYYTKAVETTMVVNQTDYIIPDDFLKVHRILIVTSGTSPNEVVQPLQPITLNQQDLFDLQSTTPEAYYLKRNRFVMVPPPDAAKVLRIEYSYLVADMVNDIDIPDVPTQYQEYIAVLATIDGFLKDGREASMMMEKKRFYEEQMKRDSENRREDGPRMVVVTRSEGWEALF